MGDTNGIWVIENIEPFVGGILEFNECIYFKHFSSKKYLVLSIVIFNFYNKFKLNKVKNENNNVYYLDL